MKLTAVLRVRQRLVTMRLHLHSSIRLPGLHKGTFYLLNNNVGFWEFWLVFYSVFHFEVNYCMKNFEFVFGTFS